MEPFEWLVFGIGLAIGSLIGARRKSMVKSAAKGYLYLQDSSHALTAGMRVGYHKMRAEAHQEQAREDAVRTDPS